ncbi:glycosyltransferase family protein [Pararhodonellum marinum]|uniref:hypothetical protein n=1 Tax=Pararhodonellum marinum TaxID=2755358 RepID=UPI00188F1B26|nr:hypothetical protein [Pararhodonellum marinum]
MKKSKIAIASVLKPVDDPRALRKIALSLRETNKYHLNIIGFCTKNETHYEKINFTVIFCKKRKDLRRLLVPFKVLVSLFRDKPQVLIISTYELIPAALIGKWLLGCRLIYDVQENYSKNLSHNKTLPPLLIPFAATYIRGMEALGRTFIDHFLLAERVYEIELPKFRPFTVLENKYAGPVRPVAPIKFDQETALKFMISGTITPVYGTEEGIQWFSEISRVHPNFQLLILGHCPLDKYRKHLEKICKNIPGICLKLSPNPLPQEELTQAIIASDLQLLPYQQTPSIREKIPTKIYELMGMGKPFLVSENSLWEGLYGPSKAGMSIDFSRPEFALRHLEKVRSKTFFIQDPSEQVSWKKEADKLLHVIENL